MKTIILTLKGMQSWGDSSKHVYRETRNEPTYSGILGLIKSSMGIRSNHPKAKELLSLRMAVRVDNQGIKECDYQNAGNFVKLIGKGKQSVQTWRYYLSSDSQFTVALTGDDILVDEIIEGLNHPCYHLYMGRLACPITTPIISKVTNDENPFDALTLLPSKNVVRFIVETNEKTIDSERVEDVPISDKVYGARNIQSVHVDFGKGE